MRKARCTKCGSVFRTSEPGRTVCQNCDGSFDNSKQIAAEAEAVKAANAVVRKAPQSVDPRNGLPLENPDDPLPIASSTTKRKARSRAKS